MCKPGTHNAMQGLTILAIRCRGSTVKDCQFVNHVFACYPNRAGWKVSTQQTRALVGTHIEASLSGPVAGENPVQTDRRPDRCQVTQCSLRCDAGKRDAAPRCYSKPIMPTGNTLAASDLSREGAATFSHNCKRVPASSPECLVVNANPFRRALSIMWRCPGGCSRPLHSAPCSDAN